jgi:hypothetical protein
MVCRPGASDQFFHVDDDEEAFYYTLIFPLTHDDPSAGTTEFRHPSFQLPPDKHPKPSQCLIFDGRTWHRGQANRSSKPRAFFYVACSGTGGRSVGARDSNLAIEGDQILREEPVKTLTRWEDPDLGLIIMGQFWEFVPEPSTGSPFVGRIDELLQNERNGRTTLVVRWLYSPAEAEGMPSLLATENLTHSLNSP